MFNQLRFRLASLDDTSRLEAIRQEAFAPIFASFRTLLGDEIYGLAQQREDEAQGELLHKLIAGKRGWTLYVADLGVEAVGFVAIHIDTTTLVGEIGLNAVNPTRSGVGIGSAMYEYALDRLREAGMQVAVVATGADASHARARRAYRKAGFLAEVPSVWMCRKL